MSKRNKFDLLFSVSLFSYPITRADFLSPIQTRGKELCKKSKLFRRHSQSGVRGREEKTIVGCCQLFDCIWCNKVYCRWKVNNLLSQNIKIYQIQWCRHAVVIRQIEKTILSKPGPGKQSQRVVQPLKEKKKKSRQKGWNSHVIFFSSALSSHAVHIHMRNYIYK